MCAIACLRKLGGPSGLEVRSPNQLDAAAQQCLVWYQAQPNKAEFQEEFRAFQLNWSPVHMD